MTSSRLARSRGSWDIAARRTCPPNSKRTPVLLPAILRRRAIQREGPWTKLCNFFTGFYNRRLQAFTDLCGNGKETIPCIRHQLCQLRLQRRDDPVVAGGYQPGG